MKTIVIGESEIMGTQLKKGDTFLRISKYGKVFGIVDSIYSVMVMDSDCNYERLHVRSTNGIDYDYSECHKVLLKLNDEQKEKRKLLNDKLKQLAERKSGNCHPI